MLIWIFVQLAMMQQFSWLEAAYFILGELELVLVLALLGNCAGAGQSLAGVACADAQMARADPCMIPGVVWHDALGAALIAAGLVSLPEIQMRSI